MKIKICDICKRRGHLANVCRSKPAPEKSEQKEEVEERAVEPKVKPKLILPTKSRLSFAKGSKRDQAREVKGMVVAKFLPDVSLNESEDEIEWLADSGASLHVCNDLNPLRSVSQLEESMLGPLPIVTSVPLVRVPNSHLCASSLEVQLCL